MDVEIQLFEFYA